MASTHHPPPDDLTGRPHVTGRTSGVDPFWWTLHEFCTGELLPYVFTDAEDERNQYTMVVSQVAARLRLDAKPAGKDGGVSIDGSVQRSPGRGVRMGLLGDAQARHIDRSLRGADGLHQRGRVPSQHPSVARSGWLSVQQLAGPFIRGVQQPI